MFMSSFRVIPQHGHLKKLQQICGSLVKMKHTTLRFRTHEPEYSDLPSKEHEWSSVYGEVQELLPEDAPLPLRKQVTLTLYVGTLGRIKILLAYSTRENFYVISLLWCRESI